MESVSPTTHDFQQTVASIGLIAQANTVCCGHRLQVSLAARQLELRRRFCSHICLRQSSQPRRRASPPGHRHPVKELHGVGGSNRGRLCHSHSPLESREVAKTMPRPLVVPVANGDSLSADGVPATASPVPVPRPEPQQPEPTCTV